MAEWGKQAFATEFPKAATDWDFQKNTTKPWEIKLYDERGRYIWWRCENDHSYLKSLVAKSGIRSSYGTKCPICNASNFERAAYKILDEMGVTYECEFMPLDMDFTGRFDIHIIDKKILIELDGEQHFKDVEFTHGHNRVSKVSYVCERDNIKNNYAYEKGYFLLRIPYTYYTMPEFFIGLIHDFINTKIVPNEIICYYSKYPFSNYIKIAELQNKRVLNNYDNSDFENDCNNFKDVDDIFEEYKQYKIRVKELESLVNEQRGKLESLEAERFNLTNTINTLSSENNTLSDENKGLRSKLEFFVNEVKNLRRQLTEALQKIDAVEYLRCENATLNVERDNYIKEIDNLKQRLHELTQDKNAIIRERNRLAQELSDGHIPKCGQPQNIGKPIINRGNKFK